MKILVAIIGLCLLVVVSSYDGFVETELTENSEAHPGACYSKSEDVGSMRQGEVKYSTTRCSKVVCGYDGFIDRHLCAPPEGCKLGNPDLSKHYPDCCPEPICD